MKGKTFLIPLVLMVVGFATVSTSLSINGIANVYNELDGFDVYFSDVRVDDIQDWTTVDNKTVLTFTPNFDDGDYVLEYDVTNASEQYDADVSVTCISDKNNLVINNEFDSSINLSAHDTKTGYVTVNDFVIGQEITIANEKFNVISVDDDTITMLAQLNIGTDYKQSEDKNGVQFTDIAEWDWTPGPKEIDIQTYSTNPKNYVNEYVSYLKTETGDSSIKGDLISLSELKSLGCTINEDYTYSEGLSCANSKYYSWLINEKQPYWWTRSASATDYGGVWSVYPDASLYTSYFSNGLYVRPIITIKIDTIIEQNVKCTVESTPVETSTPGDSNYPSSVEKCTWTYNDSDSSGTLTIGDEYAYCNEKFNVTDFDSESLTMLAQYNIGTNYRQTMNENYVVFANNSGWEYTPGPKEIDIQTWAPNVSRYINRYVSFLKNVTSDSTVTGDLITLAELGDLGCTYPSDYAWVEDLSSRTCANSPYIDWLSIDQYWYTRSASTLGPNYVWGVVFGTDIGLDFDSLNNYGVRPVITISRNTLNSLTNTSPLTDAQMFCNVQGYSYGTDYVQTYAVWEIDLSVSDYVCSNDENFSSVCYFIDDGTLLKCM